MPVNAKDHLDYAPDSDDPSPDRQQDKEKFQNEGLRQQPGRRRTSIAEGQIKHNQLGWKRLTVDHHSIAFYILTTLGAPLALQTTC